METRRRKLTSHQDADPDPPSRQKRGTAARRYFLYFSILLALFLGYVIISYDLKPARLGSRALDSLAVSLSLHRPFYVVVIDAGSTGSRALAFRFHESVFAGNLILDQEFYFETKPGLSSYADKPEEAASSLSVLLDKVKAVIPECERRATPLVMKATAGLRLLSDAQSGAILDSCRRALGSSGFRVGESSVSVLRGSDEGIFSWFTVNFLLERFADPSLRTVAALDLGGGSTQVTFSDGGPAAGSSVFAVNVFQRNLSVFTRSHLGMGLMAARKRILTYGMDESAFSSSTKVRVRSECVNPIVSTVFRYAGQEFAVRGPVNGTRKLAKTQNFAGNEEVRPVVRFEECLRIVEACVRGIARPQGLGRHEIYAFSYYFDRATEAGLVDPFFGGVVQVGAFLKQAMEECDYPNTDQPFVCLDLTFIYVLLRDGLGLDPTTKLYLYKKINGHELSWALGAAFNVVQNGF